MNDTTNYDIIADIHGRFDKLSALMDRLGYAWDGAGFVPPVGHKALFLGDLIDPKPGHRLPNGVRNTLHAVKTMCDRGDALCIMGNHEFNAICYHTKGPNGDWLRKRSENNIRTHQGTLDDFPDYEDPLDDWNLVWMPWMKDLSMALDLGGFRVVHACWHPEHLPVLLAGSVKDYDFLVACTDENLPEGIALEIILKGVEIPLPDGHSFIDHTGTERYHFRARWWETPNESIDCRSLVFPTNDEIPDVPIDPSAMKEFSPYPEDERPLFFGHYFKPADSTFLPEKDNVACLDHSAAKDGPLVAYRWKGEAQIAPDHYCISDE